MLTAGLLAEILSQYRLPWDAIHGVAHWARVIENGRALRSHLQRTPFGPRPLRGSEGALRG